MFDVRDIYTHKPARGEAAGEGEVVGEGVGEGVGGGGGEGEGEGESYKRDREKRNREVLPAARGCLCRAWQYSMPRT